MQPKADVSRNVAFISEAISVERILARIGEPGLAASRQVDNAIRQA